MAESKPKRATKKAEPKLEKTAPVTQFRIPSRYEYAEAPLEIASRKDAEKSIKDEKPNTYLEGVVVGEFVAVRNEGCDETFIIHKDVLRELAEAAD